MSPSIFSLIADMMFCHEKLDWGESSVGVAMGRSERKPVNPPGRKRGTSRKELWRSRTHHPQHSSPPPLPLELVSGNPAGEGNACLGELEGCGPSLDNRGSPWGEPLEQQLKSKLKEWESPCCI